MEKFIPLCIKKVLNDELVYIHSYPDKKESGTRFYIHARNIASAVLFLINNGKIGEKYNIAGEKEVSNLDLAKLMVLDILSPTLLVIRVWLHLIQQILIQQVGTDWQQPVIH